MTTNDQITTIYLCIVHDVDGLPRAWGTATTLHGARATAERMWEARVAKRAAEGTTDRSEERGKLTWQTLTPEVSP